MTILAMNECVEVNELVNNQVAGRSLYISSGIAKVIPAGSNYRNCRSSNYYIRSLYYNSASNKGNNSALAINTSKVIY